jgi:hypothetical protein
MYIRHFYPYFLQDQLEQTLDTQCMKTIEQIALIDNTDDCLTEIKKLLANVKDSHTNVWNSFKLGLFVSLYNPCYYPDIIYDFENDTCYIVVAGKEYEKDLQKGDIIISINENSTQNAIQQNLSKISYSSKTNGLYKMTTGDLFESETKDSVISIVVQTPYNQIKNVNLKTNLAKNPYLKNQTFIEILKNNNIYINLCSDSCTYDNFAKNIIKQNRLRYIQ